MEKEDKKSKHRYGSLNIERRRYPRINVDLPIEYNHTTIEIQQARTGNASEGGLLLYLQERMELGQQLRMKLFFPSDSGLGSIETLVEIVWMDIYLEKDWREYRTAVRFVDISPEDLERLKDFLRGLLK